MIYGNSPILILPNTNEAQAFIESGFFEELDRWKKANPDSGRKYYKNDVMTDEEYEKVKKDLDIVRSAEDYDTYRKAFARFCYFCHIVPRGVIIAKCELKKGKEDHNSLFVEYTYNTKRMELPEGATLYHMSSVDGIKELLPFFRGKAARGYLYDKPRIYFTIKKHMSKIWADYNANEKMNMYVCKENIKYVYADPMLWGPATGAVYIETNKSVKVDQISSEAKAQEIKEKNDEALEEGAFDFNDFFGFVSENGLIISE